MKSKGEEYMIFHVERGEIYLANLDPVVGSEQGGVRPVLILQNNVGNFYSCLLYTSDAADEARV